jgi:hypothetical protein
MELSREDIEVVSYQLKKFTFSTRHNELKYLTEESAYTEDEVLLEDDYLKFEASGNDWFVFRDNKKNIYLLIKCKENQIFFETFNKIRSKNDLTTLLSTWTGKKIYGYCNGYFDRDHYHVYEHTIEAIGDDWVIARDTDNEKKGRVYLAHFDEDSEPMEILLTKWENDKEEYGF